MVFADRSKTDLELEPAVTGALLASQLLSKDANLAELANMKLQVTSWSGHTPNSFDIDSNGDNRLEASATINRTIAGNLSSIEIDKRRNGRIDSTVTADRDRWGNITLLHLDLNDDGKDDAVARPLRTTGSNHRNGITGLQIDMGNDGTTDMNITFERQNRAWMREIDDKGVDLGVDVFLYRNEITGINIDTTGDQRVDMSFDVARDSSGNINRIHPRK